MRSGRATDFRRHMRWTMATVLAPLALLFAGSAGAQTSPADLPDLSLSELLQVEIRLSGDAGSGASNSMLWGRWSFQYRYSRVQFKGYRNGTKSISNASLLGTPPPPPGAGLFFVLPTKIIQEAHTFGLSYELFDRTSLNLIVPYVEQSTDHISSVPGYAKFNISSKGVGDISLGLNRVIWKSENNSIHLGGGLSFPSGSIKQQGDTPRPGPVEQLPYTMQLGSGTWDMLLNTGLFGAAAAPEMASWIGPLEWGLDIHGKIRTGKNSREYRLGNRLVLSTWLQLNPVSWLRPSLRITSHVWGRIRGKDESLIIPMPVAFFPAPVTDPRNFGGEKVLAIAAVDFVWPRDLLADTVGSVMGGQSLHLEYGRPIYQNLNGPQPEEDWRLSVGLRIKI